MFPFNDNGKMLFPKPWDSREGQWDDNINAWNVYPSVEVALEMLEYRYIGQEIPLIYEGRQTSFWFVGGTADEDFQEKIPETPTPTLQQVTNAGSITTNLLSLNGGFQTSSAGIGISFTTNDQSDTGNQANALIQRRSGHISVRSTGHLSEYFGAFASLNTRNLTALRTFSFPDDSGTLALVSDLTSGYIPLSQKGVSDGVATLDSGGTVPISQLPDSVFGQMKFGGTYDGITITASSDFPELNGQPLPAATDYEGVYFISTDDYTEGGINYVTGDWIVSTGIEWTRVANSDAVTSVFGRVGNILAVESDYQSFYPRLSQSYDNPSWVNTLSYSKITGTPDFILSGDVKPSDLVGFSGAARVPISNGSGQDFFASIAASQTASSNALARYKSDSSLSVGTATLNDEAVNLGQMNSLMGSYLPLAGNSGNPMTGDIYMGNNSIRSVSLVRVGTTADNSTSISPYKIVLENNNNGPYTFDLTTSSLDVNTPISAPSQTATKKFSFLPSDNRSIGGDPNVPVAEFLGSVTGRMPSNIGDGSGYAGSFVTEPYLSSQTGAYLPLSGGTMSGAINMANNAINNLNSITPNNVTSNLRRTVWSDRISPINKSIFLESGGTNNDWRSVAFSYGSDRLGMKFTGDNDYFSFITPYVVNSNPDGSISPNSNDTDKLRIFTADNRVSVGNPNIEVAKFFGSVTGRMDGTSDPDGYEGQFATQPYVTSQLGSYLPLSGGASSPMTGDLFMGNKGIYQASLVRVGTSADNSVDISPSAINMEIDNNGPYSFNLLSTDLGVYSPIGVPSQTATRKIAVLPVDNRSVGGNPNVTVSRFYGSVLGRMDGTSGPNGYESQFTTQNYVQNNYIAGVYDSESNIYVVSDNVRFNTVSATGTASFGIPTTSNVPTLGEHITNKSYVDNNFVDKSTNQTGIGGTKEWTGVHTFATTSQNVKVILKGNTAGGTNNTLSFNDNTDTPVGYLGFASSSAANGFYINTNNDVPVRIRSNSVDVMRLGSGGVEVDNSLSVATTVPSSATPVGGVKIGYSNSLGTYIRGNQNGSSTRAFILQGYAVSGNQLLLDMGGVSANGAYTNTSDSTIKNIVTDFDYSAVDSLKATSFTYKDNRDSGRVHVGYIAQEVREVLPDAVYESEETGLLSVDHVQVLIAKIALIEDRIKQLESLTIN